MPAGTTAECDLVIFGGGAAGLWLLDEAVRHGHSVLLFERDRLGSGQTIASQGIIHGGLKYTLSGLLNASAKAIRDMPDLWRDCLRGAREPDLRGTRCRAEYCHLWRTESLTSKLGMIGARSGLATAPIEIPRADRPAVLRECPGIVAKLNEPVIDPSTFISTLAAHHRPRLARYDALEKIERIGERWSMIPGLEGRSLLPVAARWVALCAGAGNADLRARFGLPADRMQRRPLHMTLLRGAPELLNGHCVDGARTRLTITSDTDARGRIIWQIGGQVAEDGVRMEAHRLALHVRRELEAVLPGIDLADVEWATYRVDRAEAATRGFRRPDDVQVLCEHNVLTTWPTKLALTPRLAQRVLERIGEPASSAVSRDAFSDLVAPAVASLPWEEEQTTWFNIPSDAPARG